MDRLDIGLPYKHFRLAHMIVMHVWLLPFRFDAFWKWLSWLLVQPPKWGERYATFVTVYCQALKNRAPRLIAFQACEGSRSGSHVHKHPVKLGPSAE